MPKKKRHSRDEESLYPAVKEFFLRRHCTKAVADLPNEDEKIHIPRNGHMRDIDVVGVEESGNSTKTIHIAEGKLFAKGESFEQCLSQLAAVRSSADYLWAFVPKNQWAKLSEKDQEKNRKLVKKELAGLLLVDADSRRCDVELEAMKNDEVDSDDRKDLLSQLGLRDDPRFPVIKTLGTEAASHAAKAMILMSMVEFLYKEITGSRKNFTAVYGDIADAEDDAANEADYGFILGVWEGDISVEADPFGYYLSDGLPVVWIFKGTTRERILAEAKAPSTPWSHFTWEGDNEVTSSPIGDEEALGRLPHSAETFYLSRRVELMGRLVKDVKREMGRVLKKSR